MNVSGLSDLNSLYNLYMSIGFKNLHCRFNINSPILLQPPAVSWPMLLPWPYPQRLEGRVEFLISLPDTRPDTVDRYSLIDTRPDTVDRYSSWHRWAEPQSLYSPATHSSESLVLYSSAQPPLNPLMEHSISSSSGQCAIQRRVKVNEHRRRSVRYPQFQNIL